MEIVVQYFGMLAEIAGRSVENFLVEEKILVSELKAKIQEKYPELGNKKFKIAVNLQISEDTAVIPPLSQIALLPPFAGG